MADRWSNPSGSLGVQRFRVWPGGADSYDHVENAANWDEADDIIGVPSSGTWPPTTGIDGGIYKEVALLALNEVPIGTVTFWFRPDAGIPIPTGWAVMDGSVVTAGNHEFPGVGGDVTLPNLLNASVIGADPNKSIGTAAAAVGNGNINLAAGAPGPQATGGLNEVILSLSQIASHNHGGGDHRHSTQRQIIQFIPQAHLPGAVNYEFFKRDGYTNDDWSEYSGATITSEGGGGAHENRPKYVGLIPLCKVKSISTL